MNEGRVFVIDVGQSVNTLHSLWKEYLRRDVHNILEFYHRNGTIADFDEVEQKTYDYILAEATDSIDVEYEEYLDSKIQYIVC